MNTTTFFMNLPPKLCTFPESQLYFNGKELQNSSLLTRNMKLNLFCFQSLCRVHHGRTDALIADGEDRNGQSAKTCCRKYPPGYSSMVHIMLQPQEHPEIGY